MRFLRIVLARFRGLVHRDAVAGEIREELQFHLRARTDDYEREGMTHEQAARAARRRVGNIALYQDRGYDVRGGGLMETIWQDVRYAVRLWRSQPGFALIAVSTLALGIGMTTAIASVIDAAMLHPLPYRDPDQLVELHIEQPRADRPGETSAFGPSLPDLRTIRAAANPPASVAMWRGIFRAPVADGPEPERLRGYEIDEHYLGLFDVVPIRGRGFQAGDTQPGTPAVVILGYGYWQRRFAGKDDVVGQRLRLDNESAEIIGVLPPHFYRSTAIWLPLRLSGRLAEMRGSGTATYARLRRGVTVDQARRELTDIVSRAPVLNPPPPGWSVRVRTLLERSTSGYWTVANILLAAVGLILLIACINVAGLLLARGATRLPEIAIRTSLGAGRGRLVRQLLTESVLLAFAGTAAGVLLAWWTLEALVTNIPLPAAPNAPATLNWRVLGFSVVLACLTGALFGLAPAMRLSRVTMTNALARGARRAGAALSRRGGQWLIGVEVALAVILVTGAGLMARSFSRLVAVDLGFEPGSIMTVQASPVELDSPVFAQYYSNLVQTIRQMPDVELVGAINHLPLMGSASFTSAITDAGKDVGITLRQVLPGYFEAMGLRPIAGRFPQQADLDSGLGVVVLTERAARNLFPDAPPLGRSITIRKTPAEVIGVVRELKVDGGDSSRQREYVEVFSLFRPLPDERPDSMVIVVKPRRHAPRLAEQLRQAALGVGPRAIVDRVRDGSEWLSDTVVTPRRRTVLLSLLGGLGLLLMLVGVFGMTAYAVARRTQEIGVRMVFGARPGEVVGRMVRDSAVPIAIGTAAGLAGAALATRAIQSFLFQTAPIDPATFVTVAAVLVAAGALAAWIPARRAARVDPVTALRSE